ncbi:carbon-nitrogen hydrolase family protein [Comamonas sp. JC664]|uniref:carbon-nitrogen hydrolase family protein n=1 Tax=Comamonas sp. JC664 TaxID=2801917 RepID=UPI0017491369|nr:carbon-nitrogen hydrolase family protein [Comamonas sp. JC664]GHG69576.1 hypothetical protein GCM10012319_13810 [Comamonas sp. KCTC 72670]
MTTATDAIELFAVQPRVSLEDFAFAATFTARHRELAARVDALRARDAAGQPLHPALAVWPEAVGAALLFQGHVSAVRGKKSFEDAVKRVARAEAWDVWHAWRTHHPPTLRECVYAARAALVHRTLWNTFAGIARDFGLWVVAGSALLPASRRGPDTPDFEPYGARTYNTSYTFSPEGRCVATTRKVNLVPTREDVLHLSPGRPEDLTVLSTPFGRLGTLIGYDGHARPATREEPWFVPCAQYLDALGVDILAHPASPDVLDPSAADVSDAGLPAQLGTLQRVRYVVSAQGVGDVLGTRFEGVSRILERTPSGTIRILAQTASPRDEAVLQATVPRP